jgi:N-acetylglucosamine-6-phosphate deacetylase
MTLRGKDPQTGTFIEARIESGHITDIVEVANSGENMPYLSRGFLDMQVNGYNGSDYSLEDLDGAHIERIINSLAAAGTSLHVPTIVTRPQKLLVKNLRRIRLACEESPLVAAAIVGIHIEGPFISSEDGPRGAHDGRYVRDPSFDEFLEWQEASAGKIAMVTVAPERDGTLEFIESVSKTGVVVAIGHTGASPERIREAVAAGASLSTHLGNGSHAQIPRLRNYIWEQLAADELMAGLIADGFHLPPSVMKVVARAKGMERIILVSDVALLGGFAPGLYPWGNLQVEVFSDGHIGLPGTTFLAGAAHLLDWDIPSFMRATGASLAETIGLCTDNPARLLKLAGSGSRLERGSPANLVLFDFDKDAPRLKILKTFIGGKAVFGKAV